MGDNLRDLLKAVEGIVLTDDTLKDAIKEIDESLVRFGNPFADTTSSFTVEQSCDQLAQATCHFVEAVSTKSPHKSHTVAKAAQELLASAKAVVFSNQVDKRVMEYAKEAAVAVRKLLGVCNGKNVPDSQSLQQYAIPIYEQISAITAAVQTPRPVVTPVPSIDPPLPVTTPVEPPRPVAAPVRSIGPPVPILPTAPHLMIPHPPDSMPMQSMPSPPSIPIAPPLVMEELTHCEILEASRSVQRVIEENASPSFTVISVRQLHSRV